jgi:hypothetical protein
LGERRAWPRRLHAGAALGRHRAVPASQGDDITSAGWQRCHPTARR